MLYISLVLSAILLVFANVVVRRSMRPGVVMGCAGLVLVFPPLFMLCVAPTLAIQGLLLWGCVAIWRGSGRDPAAFTKLSCGATLLAYGLGGILVYQSEREYARLRRVYPFESMEARVPEPRREAPGVALAPDAVKRLDRLEGEIRGPYLRTIELEMLHDHAVQLFINSPGFGVTRMLRPSEFGLQVWSRREATPPQPGPRRPSDWSPGEWKPAPADEFQKMDDLLIEHVVEFVYPQGFGYIKDRRHVAGFVPHRFDRDPLQAGGGWKLERLELVSLLLHDEPVVYVSDRLPEMNATHDTPTRPLDRFEHFALEELKRGEDLFPAREGNILRMMGAVRSVRQCVDCHGGGRGDLLGAFSYTLRQEESTTSTGAESGG